MERVILPGMCSYKVLHLDYMRTLVHPLITIYDPMSTIPRNPHLTLCTACSVLPCICLSIYTVSHACVVCIYITSPFTCFLLEAIQSLFQLPHSSTVVTWLTRLNNIHNMIQTSRLSTVHELPVNISYEYVHTITGSQLSSTRNSNFALSLDSTDLIHGSLR